MNLVINYDINENHIDGKYGLTEKIKQSMYNVTKEFVYIGFLLSEADEFEYYKEKGYSSIHEYASIELGFKKSSTYNFINVFRKFCKFQNGHTTMFPVDYQDFKFSQLVEMLSMNDKQIKAVTPDMSVREIR